MAKGLWGEGTLQHGSREVRQHSGVFIMVRVSPKEGVVGLVPAKPSFSITVTKVLRPTFVLHDSHITEAGGAAADGERTLQGQSPHLSHTAAKLLYSYFCP